MIQPAAHPHLLDNPVWHALNGPQAASAQRVGRAVRFDPDLTPFAALPDVADPTDWAALHELVGANGIAVVFGRRDVPPAGWTELTRFPTRQLWAPTHRPPDDPTIVLPTTTDGTDGTDGEHEELTLVTLSIDDAADASALVERTRPGPFAARTLELGRYLGVRSPGRLVAMAGERMHVGGFTEISAVCTDADHRGRGLAATLTRVIADGIVARDEVPFLHVVQENLGAIAVYESLGFTTRAEFDVTILEAPRTG